MKPRNINIALNFLCVLFCVLVGFGQDAAAREKDRAHSRHRLKPGPEKGVHGCRYVAFQKKRSDVKTPGLDGRAELVAEGKKSGVLVLRISGKRGAGKDAAGLKDRFPENDFNELPCRRLRNGGWAVSTDRIIVQFRQEVSESDIETFLLSQNAVILKRRARHKNQLIIGVTSASLSPGLARQWSALPMVLWARTDYLRKGRKKFLPNDTFLSDQWYIHNTSQGGSMINRDVYAEKAWDITRGTSSVVIAVLDDGFDLNHTDLKANVFTNAGEYGGGIHTNGIDDDLNGYTDDWQGWDFVDDDNDPSAVNSNDNHGTPIAGIAAAPADNANGIAGLANKCRLLPIRIDVDLFADSDWAEAIEYASELADVISISYYIPPVEVVRDAFNYALVYGRGGKGAVVCTALGNDGVMRRYNSDAAAAPEVISVSGSSNYDRRSWFADYGPAVNLVCPTGGGNLSLWTIDRTGASGYNTNGNYGYFSGTSASCPIAAAAAALIISQHPEWGGLEVRQMLEMSCDRIDSAAYPYNENGWNEEYGFGRVNVLAALTTSLPERDVYEPDDTADTASPIVDGEMQYRSLSTTSDVDWVSLMVATNTDLRLTVLGTTNAYLRLYDASTNLVAVDDAGFPSYSHLTVSNLAAGTYFASVTNLGNVTVASYGLHFGVINFSDAYEPDNSTNTAGSIQPHEMQYRTLYPTADVDWVTFTLTNSALVDILTMGDTDGDTVLLLRDVGGTVIASNDDYTADTYYSAVSTQLNAGTYYIEVREYDDFDLPSYQLLVKTYETDANEPDSGSVLATPITAGQRISYTLFPSNDVDWLTFTLTNRANVLIMTDSIDPSVSCDTYLSLYNSGLSLLAANDDGNNVGFSAIYQTGLDPDTYYIEVKGFDGSVVCSDYYVALDIFENQTWFESISFETNGIEVSWPGDASFTYRIEYTNDLTGTQAWTEATNVEGRVGKNSWTDNGSAPRRYYRIVTQ